MWKQKKRTQENTESLNGNKQKWVLIKPDKDAGILFFKGVTGCDAQGLQYTTTTEYLSRAHVFEYTKEQMQYILDKKKFLLSLYAAVPIQDIDIFKAKLAGV